MQTIRHRGCEKPKLLYIYINSINNLLHVVCNNSQ